MGRVEHMDSPIGPVAIPEELREPTFSQRISVDWEGDQVSIIFWRDSGIGDDPAFVGVASAHVFMTRKCFDSLPAVLQTMIEMREEREQTSE